MCTKYQFNLFEKKIAYMGYRACYGEKLPDFVISYPVIKRLFFLNLKEYVEGLLNEITKYLITKITDVICLIE